MEIANRPEKVDVVSRMEKAISSYTPGVYPGRVTLLVSSERVEDSGGETDFGWSRVSGGALEIRVVPRRSLDDPSRPQRRNPSRRTEGPPGLRNEAAEAGEFPHSNSELRMGEPR